MIAINIKFTINTKEDFHIGTGLDCIGLYDDGQVKDNNGNPAIKPETLKGLLKQSCLEIKRIKTEYADAFNEIFYFKNLGSLDLFINYTGCNGDSPFVIHTFTAIDSYKGKGEDGSLRDIEFGAKGCKFDCRLHFEMKNDDKSREVKKLLELGIKNLKWMGGYRRRGFGAIDCQNIELSQEHAEFNPVSDNSASVRLFLELLDDTCFAGAGQTGNIIHTLDYINGTTILGMLRNPLLKVALSASDIENLDFLDSGKVTVSNFYPIAKKWSDSLKDKIVIPAPLSLRRYKAVDKYASYYTGKRNDENSINEIPHWALDIATADNSDKKAFKNIVSQDTLIDDNNKDKDGASDKSISGKYLVLDNSEFDFHNAAFFTPEKNLIMRNSINESIQSTDDNAIFTQEMIERGTIFAGDIKFKNQIDADNFKKYLSDWLSAKFYFHAGRGSKPVKVKAISNAICLPEIKENESNQKQFTLTLLSDAILYNSRLMPETVIHPEYLELNGKIKLINYISSNRIHQSFSGLAGLRRFSDRTIARGSCFLYEIENDNSMADIKKALTELQNEGLGYKTEEGFGQFVINLSVHQYKGKDTDYNVKDVLKPEYPDFLAKEIVKTDELHSKAEKFKIKYPKDSKNFINKIIALMEAKTPESDIDKEIEHNMEKNTSAKDNWKAFNENIWVNTKDYQVIKMAHLKMKKGVNDGK